MAANMLVLAGKGDAAHCRAMAEAVIADGSAFAKCKGNVCRTGRRHPGAG
ncbi:hypothetical protein ACKXF4_06930 [Faecalibacterium prausnitzii]